MKTILLPFDGFYESNSLHIVTDFMLGERFIDDDGFVELSQGKIKKAFLDYGKVFTDQLSVWIKDNIGLDINLEFKEIVSPKFYNFTTDRLYAEIDNDSIATLYNAVSTYFLDKEIKDLFTPCSGFIPYYSNDINHWINKGVNDYDENELGVLLGALLSEYGFDIVDFIHSLADNTKIYEYYFTVA